MTPQELQHTFALRGIRTKIKNDEVQVEVCVFCNNDRHNLEVNPVRGVYHCWSCGARGRAETFIKDYLGLSVTIAVTRGDSRSRTHVSPAVATFTRALEDDWAWQYLTERGLDAVDAQIYEVLQGRGDLWEGRVVFPVRDYWTREVAGYNGRAALPGVRPKYMAEWFRGTKQITGYTARTDFHVVVEGIFDAVHVHQAGFNVAMLGGVSETEVEHWAARVPEPHTIVVLLDGEAINEARKLYWRILPVHTKTFVIELPLGLDPGQLDRRVIHALIRRKQPQ